MQSSPEGQSLFCVHCGLASAGLAQYPAGLHVSMRTSICAHCWLLVHLYSQYPATQLCGAAAVHWLSELQLGAGVVLSTHAPWLQ
jgi:hypothetical protein